MEDHSTERIADLIVERRNQLINRREEKIKELRDMYEKYDISLDDLKTHIEIYSDDAGQKAKVYKKDYSVEDIVSGKINDRFFLKLRNLVQEECHMPYEEVVNLMYPNSGSKKFIISITNSIEKD